jgi:3-oxoadipate enol-lactonase
MMVNVDDHGYGSDKSAIASRTEGAGAPLVLIHGVGGSSHNWDDIVERLSAAFRVIAVDLRGHGGSPPILAPCDVFALARDVVCVMDAAGVPTASIAGYSLGGQVAQAIALQWPKRVHKLLLISTVAGRTDAERAGAERRIAFLEQSGLSAMAESNRDRWFTDGFQRNHPDQVDLRMRQLLQTDPESYAHAFTIFATTDLAPRLGEISVPTLIVTGEHDPTATPRMARLMHERIPGSELQILARLRHSVLIEASYSVAELMLAFLTGQVGFSPTVSA